MSNVYSDEIVRCEKVSRIYKQGELSVTALAGVSLSVKRGEFLALCGPSGSGKTTLLNIIGSLDVPDSGEVHVNGIDLSKLSSSELSDMRLRNVGFIFQSYNLIPVLTAIENVEFVMQLQGISVAERRERARTVLNRVGLGGMESRRPSELSGGQQQRVAVARAIVSNPAIVLADEPTANLDSKTAASLLELMREMNAESNITFIFSTHDQLVMDHAKRIVKLHDGEILSDEVC